MIISKVLDTKYNLLCNDGGQIHQESTGSIQHQLLIISKPGNLKVFLIWFSNQFSFKNREW